MTMHTPGTWRVKPNSVGGPTVGPEGAVVADIRTYGGPHVGGQQHPQTAANARLIAAAPELLEALHEMVDLVGMAIPFDGPQQRKARKAIARATGEQP